MTRPRRIPLPGFRVALLLLLPLTGCGRPVVEPIVLATTTSVGNSGLLDALLPPFERDVGLRVRVHLVGSGRALRMIEDGIADVAISHAPERETALLRQHPEWFYRKLMYNDFVIVGPKDDPARAFGARNAASAMRRIAEGQARFASRGDSSGTHEREQALWNSAGIRMKAERVTTTGQGMAATLRVASEMSAYTLTDRATFAQLSPVLDLRIVFEGGGELLNTYAVIVPHEDGRPRRPESAVFGRWLTERRARDLIAGFRVRGTPAFSVWPPNRPAVSPTDLP